MLGGSGFGGGGGGGGGGAWQLQARGVCVLYVTLKRKISTNSLTDAAKGLVDVKSVVLINHHIPTVTITITTITTTICLAHWIDTQHRDLLTTGHTPLHIGAR